MHQGLQFLDIIFLALIAGFLFFRLRSVLGRRTGQERPPTNPYAERQRAPGAPNRDEVVRPLPVPEARAAERGGGPASEAVSPAVAALRTIDPSFDEASFLEGARGAHEMIVAAFAQGDRDTLRELLAPDVYEGFEAVLRDREAKGLSAGTVVVDSGKTEIADAEVRDHEMRVTVRFATEMVSFVKDAEGRLIEGHPTAPHAVTDLWTFSRDGRSRNPNWQLVTTSGEA